MRWRITGTERTTAEGPRRSGSVVWQDGVPTGSPWALERLRALDGREVRVDPVTPIRVDLRDPASAFWAATTVFWRFECYGDVPQEVWTDETPRGAVNSPQSPAHAPRG
jgi:hypothetical protein